MRLVRLFNARYPFTFLFSLVLLLGAIPSQATLADESQRGPRTITFTTFNLDIFGLGGDFNGNPGDEYRQATIKNHLDSNHLWSDVMAFEEVVDVGDLERQVVGPDYSCQSYDNPDPKHIHVVLCYRQGLRLDIADDDDNYTVEALATGRLRPAVHGILKTADGQPLAHVVAVHLKALPSGDAIRMQQVNELADYLQPSRGQLPVVILGDFNSSGDDADEFSTIFQQHHLDLRHIDLPVPYTFHNANGAYLLDHYYVSGEAQLLGQPTVVGPCNLKGAGSQQAIAQYNHDVSDHCPVTVKLRL